MNKKAYLAVIVILFAATFIVADLPWVDIFQLGRRDGVGLVFFIGLAILAEALAIDFAIGSNRAARSSIAFLPLLACPILFSPAAAVLAVFVSEASAQLLLRRTQLWLAAFNTAQGVVAIYVGAYTYEAIKGSDLYIADFGFVAFFALALAFFLTNIVIVSIVSSLRQHQALHKVARGFIGSSGGNVFYGLLASPVAVFAAMLYERMYVGGVLLMILPLLLIRYTYLSKVQLQQANRDLLRVLIKTIETRDPYTSGHSVRVSSIARTIAEDMGLSRRKIEQIETAGLLHDIGKIDMIYAAIIKKPSDLTEDERKVIKTHAIKGAELLRTLTSFEDEVIKGVRHHHEHYDGSGYPDGLAGAAIPIAARVIMLCDSIDAMLSDRPYRPALPIEQVRDEIIRCAGTQFDPAIVETIIRRGTLERAAAAIKVEAASTTLVPSTRPG